MSARKRGNAEGLDEIPRLGDFPLHSLQGYYRLLSTQPLKDGA